MKISKTMEISNLKRNVIYQLVKNLINTNQYIPSPEYTTPQQRKWNKSTKAIVAREYGLYMDQKVDDEILRMTIFLEGDAKEFEPDKSIIGVRRSTLIDRMFLELSLSDDKFLAKYNYLLLSTGEHKSKQVPVRKGNEIQTLEEILTIAEYDEILGDVNKLLDFKIIRLQEPNRIRNGGAFFKYYHKCDRIDQNATRYTKSMKKKITKPIVSYTLSSLGG